MSALLLALVSLFAAQVVGDDAPEPIPIVDGVPAKAEILAKLQPAPSRSRSFRATWEEQPGPERPARVSWRVTVSAGEQITVERFDMSAPARTQERYEASPTKSARPLSEAPIWIRWLMGSERSKLVASLHLDADRRALDVEERRVLWVLGAQANQHDRPQLRVDRATGQLQRIVERRSTDGPDRLLDVALYDRKEDGPSPWLPRRLRVRAGDTFAVLHLVSSSIQTPSSPDATRGAEP